MAKKNKLTVEMLIAELQQKDMKATVTFSGLELHQIKHISPKNVQFYFYQAPMEGEDGKVKLLHPSITGNEPKLIANGTLSQIAQDIHGNG